MLPKPLKVKDQHFPSIQAAVDHYGISYRTFVRRLDRGLSYEQALTLPVSRYNNRKTHCKRGHLLEGNNILWRMQKQYLTRACRTCKQILDRKRKAS